LNHKLLIEWPTETPDELAMRRRQEIAKAQLNDNKSREARDTEAARVEAERLRVEAKREMHDDVLSSLNDGGAGDEV